MPQINQLPVLSTVSSGDQLPVYSPNNGDARRLSIGNLLTFFQQSFASPTLAVNLYVPGSGFNITVPTPVSQDQWMLLQPAGTLATGTITLPLNTSVPDGTTVLITSTQEITSLAIALNGATAIYGGVTKLAAGTATAIRFYQPTNSWYQISSAIGSTLTLTGLIASSGTAGIGYATGAGGAVTQGTSRTTGVTLDKTTGAITLFSAAGTTVATSFTVTNSTVAATDVIILNQKSGTDLYDLMVTAVAAGSFRITFRTTGGSTTEQPVFNFAVIKGVTA
jgi:hypothetical protein